jgi:hypothetical protein
MSSDVADSNHGNAPMSQIRCRNCWQPYSPLSTGSCPRCGDHDPRRLQKVIVETLLGAAALVGAIGVVLLAVF